MNSALLPLAGIFGLGTPELLLILGVILLLFGGAKLPSLARGLGQSIKEFKKASSSTEEEKEEKTSDKKEGTQPEKKKVASAKSDDEDASN